ncbi:MULTISPECIES: MCE family protein [unclassified Mycobacterium]|uniref:MCE family protein n=1 Tax=unclassified Mycobacterium TaxID=2642494 RepID=UPI0029C60DA3|nr:MULTISPECIES: MCE family protein [unclassified Mycobacterium]
MKSSTANAAWRFAIVAVICLLVGFGMVAVFGQMRFAQARTYSAEFTSVSGLRSGNFVRIAGVEVGKVKSIAIKDNRTAVVEFDTVDEAVLTEGTKAVVRYQNLSGERYLALQEGAGSTKILPSGATIPLDRTAPALDLDALIGGFKPLFRALNPEQINSLTGQLIQALQGEGPTINDFLSQAATFTNTLADRDELIGQVITNLNVVMASVADQSKQVDSAVVSLSNLVDSLSARQVDVTNSLAHLNGTAATLADLLVKARPPLADVVGQTDRAAGLVVADHDYFTHMLDGLLPSYTALARQGLYGDFFSLYLCEGLLKVNGKGGQPVYVRLFNQTTGRCAPK